MITLTYGSMGLCKVRFTTVPVSSRPHPKGTVIHILPVHVVGSSKLSSALSMCSLFGHQLWHVCIHLLYYYDLRATAKIIKITYQLPNVSSKGLMYTVPWSSAPYIRTDTLAGLPTDLLFSIMDFLPPADLMCLSLCNHRLYEAFKEETRRRGCTRNYHTFLILTR
jgi:hypothetical protein